MMSAKLLLVVVLAAVVAAAAAQPAGGTEAAATDAAAVEKLVQCLLAESDADCPEQGKQFRSLLQQLVKERPADWQRIAQKYGPQGIPTSPLGGGSLLSSFAG